MVHYTVDITWSSWTGVLAMQNEQDDGADTASHAASQLSNIHLEPHFKQEQFPRILAIIHYTETSIFQGQTRHNIIQDSSFCRVWCFKKKIKK